MHAMWPIGKERSRKEWLECSAPCGIVHRGNRDCEMLSKSHFPYMTVIESLWSWR